MPNRNVQGDYRYAYQGQEKDPETGKEAFQLRLYDSRINRWLTTDPYRQYASPYLAMGNNWVSRVDPNGGMDCDDCPPGYDTSLVVTGDVPGLESISVRDIGGWVNYMDEISLSKQEFPIFDFSKAFSQANLISGLTIGTTNQIAKDLVRNSKILSMKQLSKGNIQLKNLYRSNGSLNGNQNVSGKKFLKNANKIKSVSRVAGILNVISLGDGYRLSVMTGDQRYLVRSTVSYVVGSIPYAGPILGYKVDQSDIKGYHLSHWLPSLYENDSFNEKSMFGFLND